MKIAIDIDEVLARGLATYLNYFNETYGTSFSEADFGPEKKFWDVLGVTEEDVAGVEAHYRASKHSKDWLLVPGAQQAIAQLARRHELVIISNRQPAGHEPTRTWLTKNFGTAFSEVYFTEAERVGDKRPTKAEICIRIGVDVLVEDELPEVAACTEHGITVVLFDTVSNQGFEHKDVVRVHNWSEATEAISSLNK